MRLLVTGAAGFIGSHYVRTLLSGGWPDLPVAGTRHGGAYSDWDSLEVTVLDLLTYAGNPANLEPVAANPRYSFVHGDIRDAAALDAVLPGHDAVVNFAAETHVDRSITGAADFVLTNVVGVQTLLDACRRAGVGRVLHVSTDEVYGSIEQGSFRETDRLEPNSPYSAAKAGGDLLARSYWVTHGVDVSVTRCTNNYGPYHYPEKVIPLFVTNLLDGLPVPLYGDGGNVRDWLHVDDHLPGHPPGPGGGGARGVLQHRRRGGADEPGADGAAAGGDGPRLVLRAARAGPAGARPSLLAVRRADAGDGLRAGPRLRDGPGRGGAVVPRPPRLVGAAEGRPRGGAVTAAAPSLLGEGGDDGPGPEAGWAVLVTGAAGQLGHDLRLVLAGRRADGSPGGRREGAVLEAGDPEVTAVDLPDLDLTDADAVSSSVGDWARRGAGRRLAVLNAAAFTAVDAAEESEDAAHAVNAVAVGNLASACADVGARLVHVSTDYVFSGDRDGPPWEPDDPAEPRSAYGRTKLAGERAAREAHADVVVLRTAWVYGAGGPNFVRTMARLERERDTVSVVDDQRGSPTWAHHLAHALVLAAGDVPPGTYHVTGGGETTWFGLTQAIFSELGADPDRVLPTTTDAFPRPAPRPAYSVLSARTWVAATGAPLPHWRDALAEAFSSVGPALRGDEPPAT